jgi:hypothetical protein
MCVGVASMTCIIILNDDQEFIANSTGFIDSKKDEIWSEKKEINTDSGSKPASTNTSKTQVILIPVFLQRRL